MSCNVRHTCISAPPVLTLNGLSGSDRTVDTLVSDGIWERKVERIWTVKEQDQSVKCTVRYQGGQQATSELKLNVECEYNVRPCVLGVKTKMLVFRFKPRFHVSDLGPYEEIKMTEKPGEATEGVANSVICSVSYKCKKNTPTIVWNYKDMQSSLNTKMISTDTYNTVSNLTFIGSLGDDGKSLTCTAQFITGETSDSATISIKSEFLHVKWNN